MNMVLPWLRTPPKPLVWSNTTHAGLFGHVGILSFNAIRPLQLVAVDASLQWMMRLPVLRAIYRPVKQPHPYDYY